MSGLVTRYAAGMSNDVNITMRHSNMVHTKSLKYYPRIFCGKQHFSRTFPRPGIHNVHEAPHVNHPCKYKRAEKNEIKHA